MYKVFVTEPVISKSFVADVPNSPWIGYYIIYNYHNVTKTEVRKIETHLTLFRVERWGAQKHLWSTFLSNYCRKAAIKWMSIPRLFKLCINKIVRRKNVKLIGENPPFGTSKKFQKPEKKFSPPDQGSARPDLDHRDRDWKSLSLNDKTKTETEILWVSKLATKGVFTIDW